MKKQIYFVRHGETTANASQIRQGPDSVLSDEGKRQSEFLAERFTHIPIDVIIASPFERTKQTAALIQEKNDIPLELSELFVERRNPSELLGRTVGDPEADAITQKIFENYHTPGWRYSDEENFEDLKKRAGEAVEYLENRPEEKILVASHGLFKRVFLARVMFGPELIPKEFVATVYSHWVRNTGITLYEHDDAKKNTVNRGWSLKVWNDHAHLG